jgi:hypothetical protein
VEADSGGGFNMEADFGGGFQYGGGFQGRIYLRMEVDFGGDCFIRRILKGCRGRFLIRRRMPRVDVHMEADFGSNFQSGGGFQGWI